VKISPWNWHRCQSILKASIVELASVPVLFVLLLLHNGKSVRLYIKYPQVKLLAIAYSTSIASLTTLAELIAPFNLTSYGLNPCPMILLAKSSQ